MIFEAADLAHAMRIGRARRMYDHGELAAAREMSAQIPGGQARLIEAACALDIADEATAAACRERALRTPADVAGASAFAAECALIDLRLAMVRYDVHAAQREFVTLSGAHDARPADRDVAAFALEGALRLAEFLIDSGRLADAARALERAERIERRLPSASPLLAARFAGVRAQHAIQCRKVADVPALLQQTIVLAVAAQAPFVATSAALSLVNYDLQRNDAAGVIAHTDTVFALATTRADPSFVCAVCARAQVGAIGAERGAANDEVDVAYELVSGGPRFGGVTLTHAAMLLKQRDYRAARDLLDRCSTEMQPLGEHPQVGALKIAEAIAFDGLGQAALAAATIADAVDLLEARTEIYALDASYRWDEKLTGRTHRVQSAKLRGPLAGPEPLTHRQRDVAGLLVAGYSYRDVAESLNISEKTVGHHTQAIFTRLNIRARWQLADALARCSSV